MPIPQAFISFDFDNNQAEILLFAGQAKNSSRRFDIADCSSKTYLRPKTWEVFTESKIIRCNMLIALVGIETCRAESVEKEISFANINKVPVFGVYVDPASVTTDLPNGLVKNRTIAWNWKSIAGWIDQCMKEGKNK